LALTYVVDTSVLTRLGDARVRSAVEPKALAGEVARTSISDIEVGFSARSGPEWDRLMKALEIFDLIEVSAEHVRRARQIQRLLASKHRRGRKVPDLIVAAAAEATKLTVLHNDADFDRIASVTGQPCEWIVPPGTVD
jgi:predicted nucleic acid-binding protein